MTTTALNPTFGITDPRSHREVRQDARDTMRELLKTFNLPEQGADVFMPEPTHASGPESQPAPGGLLKTVLAVAAVVAGLYLLLKSKIGQELFTKVSETLQSGNLANLQGVLKKAQT